MAGYTALQGFEGSGVRNIRRWLSLMMLGLWAVLPARAGQVTLDGLSLASSGGKTALTLDLSDASQYQLFTLSDPDRVVIDLLATRLTQRALPLPPGAGAVRQVRAANRPDGSLRIVLDLAARVEISGVMRRAEATSGSHLVVDLLGSPPPAVAAGSSSPSPAVAAAPPPVPAPAAPVAAAGSPAPVAPAPPPPAPPPAVASTPPAPAAAAPKAAAPAPARTPRGRDIVVAIDAGHGGKDGGAHGPGGVLEKNVTLRLAQQLAKVVDAEPGMRAVLIRNRDEFIPLRTRMERARAASADLFISVHADAVTNRKVQGSSIYVLNEKGATDEAARRLAARENAADLIGGVSLGTKDPMLASVLMDLSQNAALSSSIEVADDILRQMARVGTVRKPQVMQAPFMVLKSPDVPSVLIESAYISNPEEERKLNSESYRGKLAVAIHAGVREYFYRNPPRGTLVAELARQQPAGAGEYVIRRGDTLSGIAARHNVSIRRIRDANGLRSDQLAPGQVLRIPAAQET
ncbi:MAG: N-acetylmuramoyl-L-alanine amidase [Gammaproteobacteria bacterium]|nr:N-acetylmuramoyl-L-alanine amidase [Gammaproteobacteria bacterium]